MGKKACRRRDQESLLGHFQHANTVVCRGWTCINPLRSQVVTPVCGEVEWDCHHASVDTPSGICCFRVKGLWCILGSSLVSVEMEGPILGFANHTKGITTNSAGSSAMGKRMEGTAGVPSLWHHGSCISGQFRLLQKQYSDALAAVLIFHGCPFLTRVLSRCMYRGSSMWQQMCCHMIIVFNFCRWSPEQGNTSQISQGLVDLLVMDQLDWTLPHWTQLFGDCFAQD